MPPLSLPSTLSRSTPRVRVMTLAVLSCILAVSVSQRPLLPGIAGTVAALAGFVLVVLAALGRAWTTLFIAGSKDTALVRIGPYAACRHPLYALSLLGMLGLGLATRSVVLTAGLVALAWLLHRRASVAEESRLEALHGASARAYRADVPAWLPDGSRLALPEHLDVVPRLAWKGFLDAGALLLAFAIVDLAHVLQTAGVTPVLLRLW